MISASAALTGSYDYGEVAKLSVDRHRRILCRARPCGTRNGRQGPEFVWLG